VISSLKRGRIDALTPIAWSSKTLDISLERTYAVFGPSPFEFRRVAVVLLSASRIGSFLFCIIAASSSLFGASDKPPPGPPWRTDFDQAQREALRTGKPMFVYFTKTY
jgi:hypothetical protein